MATVGEVREGLATALSAVSGLRTSAYMPDAPKPPIGIVIPDSIDFDLNAQRGADTATFAVLLLVGRADDRASQKQLDGFLVGDGSVKAAIEADRTLGGIVDTCRVTSMNSYQAVPFGEQTFLGCRFTVEVWM